VLWATAAGAAGAALLVSGGLVTLQTVTILMALPFSVVMVIIAVSTAKAFYAEAEAMTRAQQAAANKEMSDDISAQVAAAMTDGAPLPDVPVTHVPAPIRHPIRSRRVKSR
jgi:choline/glycine/proline betaine transport protein